MKKRYLPFGYVIRDGEIRVDTEQAKIVSGIFEAYIAGNTLQQIAESMTAKQIAYRPNQITWNKNSIRRILTNDGYCGTGKYPLLVTEKQFRQAEQIRLSKTMPYSDVLAPFRKDMQCGDCGARLYWHGKSQQWFCHQCGMWSAPIDETALSASISEKLQRIQENPLQVRAPKGTSVQSIESARLDQKIRQTMATDIADEEVLIEMILRRAELKYAFCAAGDTDPRTKRIQKACAESAPVEGFPIMLYHDIVEKVILHRDAQIELELKNGQVL